MKAFVDSPTVVISTYLWIGCVCAISFLEAWLKFRAPGITLALGLGIGKLVFNALNKIEWALAASILFNMLFTKNFSWQSIERSNYIILIPLVILMIQSTWFLPQLTARADAIIAGRFVEPSGVHFYYVAAEVVKIVSLCIFGFKLFKDAGIP
ncbi:MAG: hypothetical protein ACTHJT_10175 [Cytophaga sp.]|uniref:hypothetical protein n=1 Tax=Cytophaga sp. TaxID=29535 RepID=UPI003F817450